jgi:hypothetical protein
MKAFVAAVIFAVIAAVCAAYVLSAQQRDASVAFTTSGARVSDPGHNLIVL